MDARFLLSLAEDANPPDEVDPGVFETLEFKCNNGWKVMIFYDGGELDYIDYFVSPDGEIINFWKWPEDSTDRQLLINWRQVGDMQRLLG